MPRSKEFSHRIDLLDACLRRYQRKWDATALLAEINTGLEAAWGKRIARRTLFEDLKYLQDEIAAPVEKYKLGSRVYYRYSEPDFSIKKLPLSAEDVGYLRDAVLMLRQVGHVGLLNEVEGIISKLEHTASASKNDAAPPILFEQHPIADGVQHIDDLLQAIKGELTLQIIYQPFGTDIPKVWTIHPYLLKEYRARWFLIGRKDEAVVTTVLALDRIQSIKPAKAPFIPNSLFQPDTFYRYMIGVSLPEGEAVQELRLRVVGRQRYYVLTKPIHHTQQVIEEWKDAETLIISLQLINNYELRSTLLSYGPDVEVLAPEDLRLQMAALFAAGAARYI